MEPLSPERRITHSDWLVLLAVLGALAVGAAMAFPQNDDAYMMLIIKEHGASALAAPYRDRPVLAQLWQTMAVTLGKAFWPTAFVVHIALWLAFGLVAGHLWSRVFPEWKRYAVVAEMLTVTPIVVRTQFSIVSVSLLGLLSAVLGYLGVLLLLRFADRGSTGAFVGGLCAAAAGSLASEYGSLAVVSGTILVAFTCGGGPSEQRQRGRLGALALLAVSAVGFAAYRAMGDFTLRKDLALHGWIHGASTPLRVATSLATRLWESSFGELARSAGNMAVSWQSKTTLLAAGFGAVIAFCVKRATGRPAGFAGAERAVSSRRVLVLLLVLAAALVPVAALRPTYRSEYYTRFLIPVLPVASLTTTAGVLLFVRRRFRSAAVAGIVFVAGFAAVEQASAAVRQRRTMSVVAELLEPVVRRSEGAVLAVVSNDELCSTSGACTGEVTAQWPAPLSRRVWVVSRAKGLAALGGRTACHLPFLQGFEITQLTQRSGFDLSSARWIEVDTGTPQVEPYCLGAAR